MGSSQIEVKPSETEGVLRVIAPFLKLVERIQGSSKSDVLIALTGLEEQVVAQVQLP